MENILFFLYHKPRILQIKVAKIYRRKWLEWPMTVKIFEKQAVFHKPQPSMAQDISK